MNPFQMYPPPDHVVPEALNWSLRDDGSYLRRLDGVVVRRNATITGWNVIRGEESWEIRASQVGSTENLSALHFVDGMLPLLPPDPRPGQVWWLTDDDPHRPFLGAMMILAVVYSETPDLIAIWPPPFDPLKWDREQISRDGMVLLDGPGAPWVPAGWHPPISPDDTAN
jgi:hypothetical protein